MSSATPQRTGKLAAARVDVPRSQAAAPSHLRGTASHVDPKLPEAISDAAFQRIDRPHVPDSEDLPPNDAHRDAIRDFKTPDRQAWLRLQSTDLIDRLQSWASELDAREAQLNARAALQDHRERQFRLQQQDVAAEIAEQERAVERLRQQMQAQARRLAFEA